MQLDSTCSYRQPLGRFRRQCRPEGPTSDSVYIRKRNARRKADVTNSQARTTAEWYESIYCIRQSCPVSAQNRDGRGRLNGEEIAHYSTQENATRDGRQTKSRFRISGHYSTYVQEQIAEPFG